MKIKTGYLYHIKDIFFEKVNDKNLMENHEIGRKRPTYFTIKDNDIYWFIPLSTKVEKYKKIMKNKISKNNRCDSIIIAKVFGKESAILLQNAFPILPKYIDYVHINKGRISKIPDLLQTQILKKFKKMLSLKLEGKNLFFTDIDKLKDRMIEEAKLDKLLLNTKSLIFRVKLKNRKNNIWRIMELPSFMTVADLAYSILLAFNSSYSSKFLIFHNGINYKNYKEDSDLLYKSFRYANLRKLDDLNYIKDKNLVMDYDFTTPTTYDVTYIGYKSYPCICEGNGYGIVENKDGLKHYIETETNNKNLTFNIKRQNRFIQNNFLKTKKEYEMVE